MKLSAKNGFTLIEFIIVIAILGVIAGLAVPFVIGAIDSWMLSKAERSNIFDARFALNRMVREIRQIKDDSSISTFTSTRFVFTDINNNTIEFAQSGDTLLRISGGDSNELADDLRDSGGLTFTYLDTDGNTTATAADVRMVRIQVIIESGGSSVTLRSLSRLRNI